MADPSNLPPLPKNHLDHPEQWATGADPATDKQKGFLKVLEGQHPDAVPEGGLDVEAMGKSEASEVIEKLKNGKKVDSDESKADIIAETKGDESPGKPSSNKETTADTSVEEANADDASKSTTTPSKATSASQKRKTPASASKSSIKPDVGTPSKKGASSQNDADDEASSDKRTTRSRAKTATESQTADDEKKGADSQGKDVKEDEGHVEKKSKRDVNADADGKTTDKSLEAGELVTPHTGSPSAGKKNTEADTAATTTKPATESETVPGDGEHLDHPENWTTGDEPATEKQKGFLAVLEKKKGMEVENMNGLGKSEASEKIDELK